MAKALTLDSRDQSTISILLEEYRALYAVALFRMSSLERRVPIGVAAITALLASVLALTPSNQIAVLLLIPLGLVWHLTTTINHARSFEDVLRRIDEIEREVNTLAARELLLFQSSHPSRGKQVGGRTGNESVRAVFASSTITLLASLWLFWGASNHDLIRTACYGIYLMTVGGYSTIRVRLLARYRYDKRRPGDAQAT